MKKFVSVFIPVAIILSIIVGTVLCGFFGSKRLSVERYDCGLGTNVKIAHLSDLHFPKIGIKTEEILGAIEKEHPDLIALTGDILDGDAEKNVLSSVENFFDELTKTATVIAVIGNHEIGSPYLSDYKDLCKRCGVTLLIDSDTTLTVGKTALFVYGVNDSALPKNAPDKSGVSLLLAHRPEKIKDYAERNFDIVLSGHAHGGQVRFFNAGLYAPDQGLFPKYTSGKYAEGSTVMIVNRGLGNGNSSFRIFNPYELGIILL